MLCTKFTDTSIDCSSSSQCSTIISKSQRPVEYAINEAVDLVFSARQIGVRKHLIELVAHASPGDGHLPSVLAAQVRLDA